MVDVSVALEVEKQRSTAICRGLGVLRFLYYALGGTISRNVKGGSKVSIRQKWCCC